MKKALCTIIFLFSVTTLFAQLDPYLVAQRQGCKIIKQPQKGRLKWNVSMEYRDIVRVYANGTNQSCTENYSVKMTTAKGRVVERNDCRERSMGTIHTDDYPVRIDVKYKDWEGEWLDYSVEVIYPGYSTTIDLYKE